VQARIAVALLRNRRVRTALLTTTVLVLCLPVIVTAGVVGVFAHEAGSACATERPAETAAGGGAISAGMYAAPLELTPGHWYEVGATEYGGPEDTTSGTHGSIPDPGESYLPSHPDSYAELSVLSTNPANNGTFTFNDANALGNLAYLTPLRVAHAGHEAILAKRDVGYGQGPGQTIGNGQPYRLDVWWQAAHQLDITKTAVKVQLTPPTGAGATLQELPDTTETSGQPPAIACEAMPGLGDIPLPLSAGTQTKILPSGLAAAGQQAPEQVKAMVAAGNRLFGADYLYGGAHGPSLNTLQPAYDCSSAVSYLLHAGRSLGPSSLGSTGLESYGQPGPGRYVTIYANPAHAFIYIAGLRFDTVYDTAYDSGPNSGKAGPRWRVSPTVPDWSTWTVRHPPGL
jgi:hypothetical protein